MITFIFLAICFVFFFVLIDYSFGMDRNLEKEQKLGEKISLDIEEEYGLEEDPVQNQSLNRIGQELAEYSILKGMNYHFKILKKEGPNAFSIPGGYIYVTSDLFDYTQSDHELAGILAHEIAHVIHNHALKQTRDNTKFTLLTILGALLTGEPDVMVLGKLTTITFLNQYSREYEEEADLTAIELMFKAGYNPVGFLTYMERLYSREMFKPSIDLGIYQTHPDTINRINYIKKKLDEKGIEINRRDTTDYLKVNSKYILKDSVYTGVISIDDIPVLELASSNIAEISHKINEISQNLDRFLSIDLVPYEMSVFTEGNNATLLIRNNEIVTLSDSEIFYSKRFAEEILQEMKNNIRKVLWEFQLNLPFDITEDVES